MIKKLRTYGFWLIASSTLLWSCAGQADEEVTASTDNSARMEEEISPLPQTMSIKDLNGAQRNAFEAKSIQKLQDFFDYLKIISDPEVSADLRNHSYNLALDLFVNDTVTVTDSLLQNGTPIPIQKYLSSILVKKNKVTPLVYEVIVAEPLVVDSSETCNGKLNAKFSLRNQQLNKTIAIHLIEVNKTFGETNQKTIEVKLGNIY